MPSEILFLIMCSVYLCLCVVYVYEYRHPWRVQEEGIRNPVSELWVPPARMLGSELSSCAEQQVL